MINYEKYIIRESNDVDSIVGRDEVMNIKKIKLNIFVAILLGVVSLFAVRAQALEPPYLVIRNAQDVITKNNAILHVELTSTGGEEITEFEIVIRKDEEIIYQGEKPVNMNDSDRMSISFDLNKDFSWELSPSTTYTYFIYAKSHGEYLGDLYRNGFRFTTLDADSVIVEETTTATQETTTTEFIPYGEVIIDTEDTDKRPSRAKIKSAKNSKKRSIVLKIKKLKNAKRYQIQYAKNRKFKNVKSKRIKKATYTIKKLQIGRTYYVRVRGINGTKKGAWSKIKKVKIKK